MFAVQPVTHEFFAGAAFALSDLRFMMRENVVHAAAVDVNLIAQQRGGHGAALYVPAGATATPRTFPADLTIFFILCFPKGKVADVFFIVLVMFHAPTRLQLREVEMGKLSVIGKLVDTKID